MNRYLLWYKNRDGYEKFSVFKNKESIWRFITSFDVCKIYKIRYIRWYELVYMYLMYCFGSVYDFFAMGDYHEPKLNDSKDYNAYEASNRIIVKKVLKDMDITNKDSIIDVGSGKGYVLRICKKFPFKRIYGVEVYRDLAKIAQRNCYGMNTPTVCCDATEFKDYYLFNYFFLFNPFDGEMMHKFLDKIKDRNGITVIYNNPVCKEMMESFGFEVVKKYKDILGFECWVYKK